MGGRERALKNARRKSRRESRAHLLAAGNEFRREFAQRDDGFVPAPQSQPGNNALDRTHGAASILPRAHE